MTTLAFIVPAYRRFELARVCLAQLARTCDELNEHGIAATAVVVADDANLGVADRLGFATVAQENRPFGRKWNDGIEYACRYLGVDYVVPAGTDNWITPELVIAQVPPAGKIGIHRVTMIVHEDGDRMGPIGVGYPGGDGIRTIPVELLEPLRFRPAADDKDRAIDTSIWHRLAEAHGAAPRFHEVDLHVLQAVSFQSADEQLNDYRSLRAQHGNGPERTDVWDGLAEIYPQVAVDEAREVYERRMVAA